MDKPPTDTPARRARRTPTPRAENGSASIGVGKRTNATGTVARPVIADDSGEIHNVGLDQLLAQAASNTNRFVPDAETLKASASRLAQRPEIVVRHAKAAVSELANILAGNSERAPARGDARFRDPAWTNSWLFRRICQSYLTLAEHAQGLVEDADLDWENHQRIKLVVDNLVDALSPNNFPLTNPSVLKATVDKGGSNFVTGARAAIRDARSPLKLPASVDKSPFRVGVTMATSVGAVVRREDQFELIQYRSTQPRVREIPVLLIPPMISKFYVVDLSPGKSMVQFLAEHELQPFVLSWRNVTKQQQHWDFDSYIEAICQAIDTVREVTGSDSVHLVGFCAGGMATTATTAHLAALGQMNKVASLNIMVTVVDMERGGPVMSLMSPEVAAAAKERISRKGYLAGTELGRTFAWLRPNEMIWNNFVNNYYLGNKPPALDLLFWNTDSMNMPAALHRNLLDIGLNNPLPEPAALEVLGTPLDLSEITCDAYVVGGETDHLTPWPNCYRTTQLLGGDTLFVLSTSGHIAAVIHPPGNPKSAYRVGPAQSPTGEEWHHTAEKHSGTWWQHWAPWLQKRAGEAIPAPQQLGSATWPAIDPAPGKYVHQQSRG